MPIKLQIRDRLIEVTFLGNITGLDLQQQIETLRDLESRLEVSPDRVTDLSAACDAELPASDVVLFAEERDVAKLKNKIKSAIIAPSPIQYGLARMFMACNKNPAIEIRLFREASSAYDWIGHARPADGMPQA